MKKIVTIVAAALIASAAFAQVSIGAWGRGFFTPFAFDGDKAVMQDGISWGSAAAPRVGFTVAGSSENVGFVVDMNGDGGAIGAGDCQYIWVKPVSMLNVMIGKTHDLTLRGDACFGMFNWLRVGAGNYGEDFIFTRTGNGAGSQLKGALVTLDPIEGLHISLGVNVNEDNWAQTGVDVKDIMEKGVQVAAGYTIANVGTIKAQYIAKGNGWTIEDKPADSKWVHAGMIEAAFDLTAVENLFVSVGAKIPTADVATITAATADTYGWVAGATPAVTPSWGVVTAGKPGSQAQTYVPQVNAYGKYTFGMVTVHALFGAKFNVIDAKLLKDGKKYSEARAVGIVFGAGADIALENGLGIVADVRYQNGVYASSNSDGLDCLTFLAGVTKGFSNGLIGIGFEGSTNNNGPFVNTKASKDVLNFAVPVKVEYWF
jgi:hypothetical protein